MSDRFVVQYVGPTAYNILRRSEDVYVEFASTRNRLDAIRIVGVLNDRG